MSDQTTFVGIDVGSSKISTLIAEVDENYTTHVIGVGDAPGGGIRNGVVVNIDEAVKTVQASVEKAERVSGFKIMSAYVTVSGSQVESLNNRGVVAIANDDKTIDSEDVARAIESARIINLTPNREIVHALPRHFMIDGQDGVRNPLRMIGYRLDVETHIVTTALTSIRNLTKCVQQLGIEVDELVISSLAAGEAVLTPEEKELGVMVADVGAGTTDLAIYNEGSVWQTKVLPIGGEQVSKEIAVQLRTPLAEAEALKVRHGDCRPSDVDSEEVIDAEIFGQGRSGKIGRRGLCEIIEDRSRHLIQQIEGEIKRLGPDAVLPAGLVLAGGVARTPGLAELASEVLNLPVRVGTPNNLSGLTDNITIPSYAAGVGLVLWAAKQATSGVPAQQPGTASWQDGALRDNNETDVAGKFRTWLKAFLP